MTRVLKWFGWTMLVAIALSVALVAALVTIAGPLDHTVIQFDGGPVTLAEFGPGEWLIAVGGVAVGLLVLLVVLPVAVLVPMLFAALALIFALVIVVGVAALAFSPLIAVVALVWLIWRLGRRAERRRAHNAPQAGATIAR